MRRTVLISAILSVAASGAVTLDRIAVVVERHAIKASDIDHDLRVTAFLNQAATNLSLDARKQSAGRLVDQTLIREEISSGDYDRATDSDAQHMLAQLRHDRFGGADGRLREDLARYGLTEAELADALLWQLTVLRFIDQRFRPAVMVTDENVKTYFDSHQSELKRQNPKDSSLEALQPKIRELLEGQEIDKQFDAWLEARRRDARVQYHQEAFE